MDFEVDEEMSSGYDDEDQNEIDDPYWQCGLTNLQERAMALSRTGKYTDLTLTFPGTDIAYGVHCLILAMTSPVFENILYGPMKPEGGNLELHDDPVAISYVLAYCYGDELDITDLDTTLEVYKLADKYIMGDLKKLCCKHIVSHMNKDNVKEVIEFADKFNFTDFLKSNCVPHLKEIFDDIEQKSDECNSYENEPDYADSSSMLMDLNDAWLEALIPGVYVKVLDFHDSWKYPVSPLIYSRLSIILSNKYNFIEEFYGCINAENICQLHLGYNSNLQLCLSVTDPHHAKRVIEAINQQKRFEKHLIAIHIRCEGLWPRNWLPLRTERTHRPSMLLISDTDDEKVTWIIEAAKALLPNSEGSYNMQFGRAVYEDGERFWDNVKPVTILKLPRSKLTLKGLACLRKGLKASGMIIKKIIMQSPNISNKQQMLLQQCDRYIQCVPMDYNFFKRVFKEFPRIRDSLFGIDLE